MTKAEAITELVRIWHSPHLDLILKERLGEVIETLKEKNQSDSLVRDEAVDCKESESKLDLISRQDAIDKAILVPIAKVVTEDKVIYRRVVFVEDIESLPSAEMKTGEWVWSDEDASWKCACCDCVFEEIDWKPDYNFCPNCGARMTPYKGGDSE